MNSKNIKVSINFPDEYFLQDYTCDGLNMIPTISWELMNPYLQVKSFAITIFDPDARPNGWWHLLAYNIPQTITSISSNKAIPGMIFLKNSFGNFKYEGPCPPLQETHEYVIKVFALPFMISDEVSDKSLIHILETKSIGYGEIVKKYKRI